MGKKAEEGGSEIPGEKKVTSPVAEGEVIEDRKDRWVSSYEQLFNYRT